MVVRRYSTTFPLTENPISEASNWINGGTTGLDWTNARITPGKIFGTQPGDSANIYDDSVACLSGVWGNDQAVEATIFVTAAPPICCGEVELHLRRTITANNSRGYEVTASIVPGNPYLSINWWPGAKATQNSDFGTMLPVITSYCVDGDVLGATVVGNLFTIYKNGIAQFSTTDTQFPTGGSPGLGFFVSHQTGLIGNWGFSKFAANDAGVLPSKLPTSSRFTIGRGSSG